MYACLGTVESEEVRAVSVFRRAEMAHFDGQINPLRAIWRLKNVTKLAHEKWPF